MVSAVRSRPNHYETLGLSPSASDDDIRSAFTRMMGMFGAHPVAAATTVSAAFEVLRNPAKRRAYDRDLGLLPEPKSAHWKVAGVGWSSPGLTGSAWAPPAQQQSRASDAPAKGDALAETDQGKPAEPRLATFISSSLRDLARPIPPEIASDDRPLADPTPVPAEPAAVAIERGPSAAQRTEAEMTLDAESSPLDLRRPALVALGAIAAAGLIGAIAGASVGAQEQAPPAKRGVTVTLPMAAPKPNGAMDGPIATATIRETQVRQPARAEADADAASDKRAERRRLAASARLQAENSQLAESKLPAAAAVSSNDPAESAAAPKAVAANLPLPDRVIARTIARIGYSCGTVLSTTTEEGAAPGVYKVACSSGQTFQATPVRGRYRFRRQ